LPNDHGVVFPGFDPAHAKAKSGSMIKLYLNPDSRGAASLARISSWESEKEKKQHEEQDHSDREIAIMANSGLV
jgi:hypothetical protein